MRLPQLLAALCCLLIAVLPQSHCVDPHYAADAALFASFMERYNIAYASDAEHAKRFGIFRSNLPMIRALDAKEGSRGVYGITRFADLTQAEFAATRLGRRGPHAPIPGIPIAQPESFRAEDLPKEIDWHKLGGTTKVYDQGQCGSCWAFSTVEQVESMWWVKHGRNATIPSLSPQQIVDCDRSHGDDGCNGGDTTTAYKYLIKQGGLEYWDDYPYVGQDEKKCHWNKSDSGARVKSWSYVTTTKNETEMLQYVGTTAPVSICVDAATWQFYIGGVIKHICGPASDLDHCVQIVGYGDDLLGTPYWLIRNSWGELWGELGYLKVERNKNLCGVAEEVTTCDVKKKN